MTQNNWSVYLITNDTHTCTYVGATTDVTRRLRQHCGEIRGGARSTRGCKWELLACVTGFADRSEAYRWEKIVKSRARGALLRYTALLGLLAGRCPAKKGRKQYPVPDGLRMWGGE